MKLVSWRSDCWGSSRRVLDCQHNSLKMLLESLPRTSLSTTTLLVHNHILLLVSRYFYLVKVNCELEGLQCLIPSSMYCSGVFLLSPNTVIDVLCCCVDSRIRTWVPSHCCCRMTFRDCKLRKITSGSPYSQCVTHLS